MRLLLGVKEWFKNKNRTFKKHDQYKMRTLQESEKEYSGLGIIGYAKR